MSSNAFAGRLLVVIQAHEVTGPGRQLAALASHLPLHGIDVRIAVLQRTSPLKHSFTGLLANARIPHEIIRDLGPLDVGVLREVERLIARWKPDIVQTHGYKASAIARMLRVRGDRRAWVGCYHGWTHEDLKARFYHWLDHWMLGSADRIVVMSRRQHEDFAHHGRKVRVIHNAVIPVTTAESSADSERLDGVFDEAQRPLLGVVARLSPEKGVDVFLHALRDVVAHGQRLSAIIVGDGPEREPLESLSTTLGLGDRVRFVGSIAAMSTVYRGIDLLVIPSRSEGLPNVLLEALGADVPVVATAVGAIPEVLGDPAAGVLVPAGDSVDLATGIRTALAGLSDQRSARNARRTVAESFSLERRVAAHLELYRDLLRQPAGAVRHDLSAAARA